MAQMHSFQRENYRKVSLQVFYDLLHIKRGQIQTRDPGVPHRCTEPLICELLLQYCLNTCQAL